MAQSMHTLTSELLNQGFDDGCGGIVSITELDCFLL